MIDVIRRNLFVFGVLAVGLSGPPQAALNGWIAQLLQPVRTTWTIVYAQLLVIVLLSATLQGAIVQGVALDQAGERVDFRRCLSATVPRLVPLFGASLLIGAGIIAGLLVTVIAASLMPLFGVLMLPVYLVLVVIAASAWIAAVPAIVVERRRIFDAFVRSAKLTRNHRWAIFALMATYAAVLVLEAVAAGAVGPMARLAGPAEAWVNFGAAPLLNSIVSLIGAAGVASIYFELRSIRDTARPEALASVFD